MCAKHYENPTMLSKVTAKNVGDVFLRHTVYTGYANMNFFLCQGFRKLDIWQTDATKIIYHAASP